MEWILKWQSQLDNGLVKTIFMVYWHVKTALENFDAAKISYLRSKYSI